MPRFEDDFADDVAITDDDLGGYWLAVTISRLDHESIVLRHVHAGEIETFHPFEAHEHAFRPSILADSGACIVGAAVLDDGKLRPDVVRVGRSGSVRKLFGHALEGDCADVVLADTGGAKWVAFDEIRADETVVWAGRLGEEPEPIEGIGSLRTPTIDAIGDTVWLACVEGDLQRNVALFRHDGDGWERVATLKSGTAEAPDVVALGGDDVIVAWHEQADACMRWIRAARVLGADATELRMPRHPTFDRTNAPTDQSWEFPRLAAWHEAGATKLAIAGRSAQNFHVAVGDPTGVGELVPQCPEGWGGTGRLTALKQMNEQLIFARRQRGGVHVEPVVTSADPLPSGRPDYGPEEVDPPAEQTEPFDGIVWGQFHQHSAHSDATGSVWDVLLRAKRHGFDFTALTDHDRFCGKAIGPATWRYFCSIFANLEDDDFAVLPAVEFTGARHPGPGHKNLYFEGELPTKLPDHTIAELTELIADHPAIVIPHHVGFTGWDIEHHGAEFQPLWEICSVHGDYEYDDPDTVFPPRDDALIEGHTIRAALDAGHRFGLCAAADDHGLLFHHGATPRRDPTLTGLTAVITDDRSRPGILGALRERRCYATSGAQIALDVSLDAGGSTVPMGSDVEALDAAVLSIRVRGTNDLASVEVVRRGSDTALELDGSGTLDTRVDLSFDGPDYVYVRVKQTDDDMAWSSPIFVG